MIKGLPLAASIDIISDADRPTGKAGFGITMTAEGFLALDTMKIIVMGVLIPLVGSANVRAVPMAARASDVEGQKADPTSYLLMHAMGPNMVGFIGIALLAGFFIAAITP